MLMLLALAQVLLFLLLCHKSLKKYPFVFYGAALGMDVFLAADGLLQFTTDWPAWIYDYILSTFHRGAFATALFTVIMFIGALDAKKTPVKRLMRIRAEMSVFACLLTFGHNLIYGYAYFPVLFTRPQDMRPEAVAASVVTLVMLVMLLPLFVTSFAGVRKRMPAKKWKNLQRWAYPFYLLILVHVWVLFAPRVGLGGNYLVGLIVYTAVYGAYVVLRLQKYARRKKQRAARASARPAPVISANKTISPGG